MASEQSIEVCFNVLDNWKDTDRTAFMDSIKELAAVKDYTSDLLTKTINAVTKAVKEMSSGKNESHDGYMERILQLKKKLKEKEVLLKKKETHNAKVQTKSLAKEKQLEDLSPQSFAKDLPEGRRKCAKFLFNCMLSNYKQKYDQKALEKFVLSLEEQVDELFEGDAGKITKHYASLKINLISPKSSFAKTQMILGNIPPKEVATNKTSVFEDKSTQKKLNLTGPQDKQQELTGNGEQCQKCRAMEAYCYMMQQIRASDEPMTRFLRCRACKETWTD